MKKRDFIKTAGLVTTATMIQPISAFNRNVSGQERKKALILGGRFFLGPSIVE